MAKWIISRELIPTPRLVCLSYRLVVPRLSLVSLSPVPYHTTLDFSMAAPSKIPWDKLKADTLRAICRDFGANPGKRKREGMLEFLRAVETTGRASRLCSPHPHRPSPLTVSFMIPSARMISFP